MTDRLPSESFARMADALERIADCLESTSYEVPTVQAAWEQAFSEDAVHEGMQSRCDKIEEDLSALAGTVAVRLKEPDPYYPDLEQPD